MKSRLAQVPSNSADYNWCFTQWIVARTTSPIQVGSAEALHDKRKQSQKKEQRDERREV